MDKSGNEVDGGGHNDRLDKPWLYMSDAEFARYCFGKPLSTIYAMDNQRAEKKRVEKIHQQIVKQYPNSRVDPKKPNANGKKLTGGKSGGSSTKKPTPPKPTPPKKLTNVKVECPDSEISIKEINSIETKVEYFSFYQCGIKISASYYQKVYKENLVFGNKEKMLNIVNEKTISSNDDSLSVESAIELFKSLGISLPFSWSEISISLYARLGDVMIKLTGFISLNIFWGTHGFRLTVEQDYGKGLASGITIEASAHALVIALALFAIYGTVPTLVPLLQLKKV